MFELMVERCDVIFKKDDSWQLGNSEQKPATQDDNDEEIAEMGELETFSMVQSPRLQSEHKVPVKNEEKKETTGRAPESGSDSSGFQSPRSHVESGDERGDQADKDSDTKHSDVDTPILSEQQALAEKPAHDQPTHGEPTHEQPAHEQPAHEQSKPAIDRPLSLGLSDSDEFDYLDDNGETEENSENTLEAADITENDGNIAKSDDNLTNIRAHQDEIVETSKSNENMSENSEILERNQEEP
eukprot:921695_1